MSELAIFHHYWVFSYHINIYSNIYLPLFLQTIRPKQIIYIHDSLIDRILYVFLQWHAKICTLKKSPIILIQIKIISLNICKKGSWVLWSICSLKALLNQRKKAICSDFSPYYITYSPKSSVTHGWLYF